MMRRSSFLAVMISFFLIIAIGCGYDENKMPSRDKRAGGNGVSPTPVPVVETYAIADYFPLTQGNWWEYDIVSEWKYQYLVNGEVVYEDEEYGEEGEYYIEIEEEMEMVGGVEAISVYDEWEDSTSLWTSNGDGITLYEEYRYWYDALYDPPVNYLPGVVEIGTQQSFDSEKLYTGTYYTWTWTEPYSGTTTVEGTEEITAPAGVFETLRIVTVLNDPYSYLYDEEESNCSFSNKVTMWLAEGIGKVKQETRIEWRCAWYYYDDETGEMKEEYIYTETTTRILTGYGNGEGLD